MEKAVRPIPMAGGKLLGWSKDRHALHDCRDRLHRGGSSLRLRLLALFWGLLLPGGFVGYAATAAPASVAVTPAAASAGSPALTPVGPGSNLLQERSQRFTPQQSGGGMVAAQERRAAAVGAAILRRGGNAVDAAVATSFALAVTLPQAGNIGGGGFLVLWLPRRGPIRTCAAAGRQPALAQALPIGRGEAVAVNFRETAPPC